MQAPASVLTKRLAPHSVTERCFTATRASACNTRVAVTPTHPPGETLRGRGEASGVTTTAVVDVMAVLGVDSIDSSGLSGPRPGDPSPDARRVLRARARGVRLAAVVDVRLVGFVRGAVDLRGLVMVIAGVEAVRLLADVGVARFPFGVVVAFEPCGQANVGDVLCLTGLFRYHCTMPH